MTPWPAAWAFVPRVARFECAACGHPIPGFRSCPRCHPEGWDAESRRLFSIDLEEPDARRNRPG